MANNQCEIQFEKGKIICLLPITLPTSKIRIKRNDSPLAVRQVVLENDDLIEWQISYYDQNRKLVEIGEMLKLAYKNNLILRKDLNALRQYAESVREFFAESFSIEKLPTSNNFLNEFQVLFRKVPIIHRDLTNGCFVESELKHKQRAVGYQPMLYIFIPMKNVVSRIDGLPIIKRTAHANEIALWSPTMEDIKGTIKTFSVLSKMHNQDIREILTNLL